MKFAYILEQPFTKTFHPKSAYWKIIENNFHSVIDPVDQKILLQMFIAYKSSRHSYETAYI